MIGNINNRIVEANVKLQDENKLLKEDKQILQRRIERAIEYIEENDNKEPWKSLNGKELLEILKGEYIKEEK